jgi:hypothetical protein
VQACLIPADLKQARPDNPEGANVQPTEDTGTEDESSQPTHLPEGVNLDKPKNLREYFLKHLIDKVSKTQCECCGHDSWTILMTSDDPNATSNLPHGRDRPTRTMEHWPVLSVTCQNCYHMRLFAAGPLIAEYEALQTGGSKHAG